MKFQSLWFIPKQDKCNILALTSLVQRIATLWLSLHLPSKAELHPVKVHKAPRLIPGLKIASPPLLVVRDQFHDYKIWNVNVYLLEGGAFGFSASMSASQSSSRGTSNTNSQSNSESNSSQQQNESSSQKRKCLSKKVANSRSNQKSRYGFSFALTLVPTGRCYVPEIQPPPSHFLWLEGSTREAWMNTTLFLVLPL